ncbi:MAG: hypothetical protein J5912_00025 [Clostridia bacterium]|nr:hypothetical protein [Clostridia bacterium]
MKKRLSSIITVILAALLLFAAAFGTFGCDRTEPSPGGNRTAEPAENTQAPADPTEPPERHEKQNVAKIILIGGQSNAVGASLYTYLKGFLDDDKYKALGKGYENVRTVYYAGEKTATNFTEKRLAINDPQKLFQKTRYGMSITGTQFGIELGLADYFTENYPDEHIYIIKCARGGIPIKGYWLEGDEYFERLCEMTEKCCAVLKDNGYEPEIMAICWLQGENEGLADSLAKQYYDWQNSVATRLRDRLKEYAPYGGIPFVDAGISTYWAYYKTVNENKQKFANDSPNNYYIDVIGLGLEYNKEPHNNPDLPHYDADSMWNLGLEFGRIIVEAYSKVK